ncbi:MAG: c-type cytochrome domain-containing protein [Bdellovibrionota bacterium]
MRKRYIFLAIIYFGAGTFVQSCGFHRDKGTDDVIPYGANEPEVALGPDYVSIRRNIFVKRRCFACHLPGGSAYDTPLEPLESLLKSQKRLVEPGNVEESGLYLVLIEPKEKKRMPPAKFGPRLTEKEIELIRQWIQNGAPKNAPSP